MNRQDIELLYQWHSKKNSDKDILELKDLGLDIRLSIQYLRLKKENIIKYKYRILSKREEEWLLYLIKKETGLVQITQKMYYSKKNVHKYFYIFYRECENNIRNIDYIIYRNMQISNIYNSGKSLNYIAEMFNLTKWGVRLILNETTTSIRRMGRERKYDVIT